MRVKGDNPRRDIARDKWLRSQGIEIMRFPAVEVLKNLDGVLQAISMAVDAS